jgi:hypothetical protein
MLMEIAQITIKILLFVRIIPITYSLNVEPGLSALAATHLGKSVSIVRNGVILTTQLQICMFEQTAARITVFVKTPLREKGENMNTEIYQALHAVDKARRYLARAQGLFRKNGEPEAADKLQEHYQALLTLTEQIEEKEGA